MVARAYDSLGGIKSVVTNAPAAYSTRGNDKDRFQTFIFGCSQAAPFSGTVELQGSVDSPTIAPDDSMWTTFVSLDFYGERDSIFLETEVETARIRVKCVRYDSNAAISASYGGIVQSGGTFEIDGVAVAVVSGDTLANVATKIALAVIPNIDVSTILVPNSLIITKNDGSLMTLEDTIASPLHELGILSSDDSGLVTINGNGAIDNIKAMR